MCNAFWLVFHLQHVFFYVQSKFELVLNALPQFQGESMSDPTLNYVQLVKPSCALFQHVVATSKYHDISRLCFYPAHWSVSIMAG